MIYWFTGQPGAGKTSLSDALYKTYFENRINFLLISIDGDDLRNIFGNNNYTDSGRKENIKRAQEIAKFLHKKKFVVFVSLVSPYREQREAFKKEMGKDITEIYVHTSDKRGRENFHVENYEQPYENFVEIDTTNKTVDESLNELLKKLKYV